jgi:diacylglycerol O-acyltransferase
MERLTGLDAGFLYMETPTLHMHTLKIAVLDPSTIPDGYSFQRVKDELAGRLHLLPPFRRRLVEIPLRLHHPVWIEDPDFDLDRHVRRVDAPSPGGIRELASVISDVAGHQLDRTRPLWEIHVVEGLADGRVGFVTKMHHAVADGVAAADLLVHVLDEHPDADVKPPEHPWRPEREPSSGQLLRDALVALGVNARMVPSLVVRTAAGVRNARRFRGVSDVAPPLPFAGPNLPFNAALTPRRLFTMTTLPLGDVKAVKDACGTTLNDVVLAVCGGALRRWLLDRDLPTDRPLVAGVPVSTREKTGLVLQGNVVSNMFTTLRTDLADPIERLRATSAAAKAAKGVHAALGPQLLADWSEVTPPRPFAWFMRQYSRFRLADRHRPPINLVVSNVPGPREPLYVTGARLDGIWSVGPILEGIGLNITMWSYLDDLNVGMVACPDSMPDLWELTDLLPAALDELVSSARR